MSRLRPLPKSELSDQQHQVWDAILVSRKGLDLVDVDGGLVGPFNAMVHAPHVGLHQSQLGQALRYDSTIPQHLLELAICVVGAHWRSEFEFWAHRPLAIAAGVAPDVVDAIRAGCRPTFADQDQEVVYSFTSQLLDTNRVDEGTFDSIRQLLGEVGTVELSALIGYYCMISLTLNAFAVPLPVGEAAIWVD